MKNKLFLTMVSALLLAPPALAIRGTMDIPEEDLYNIASESILTTQLTYTVNEYNVYAVYDLHLETSIKGDCDIKLWENFPEVTAATDETSPANEAQPEDFTTMTIIRCKHGSEETDALWRKLIVSKKKFTFDVTKPDGTSHKLKPVSVAAEQAAADI